MKNFKHYIEEKNIDDIVIYFNFINYNKTLFFFYNNVILFMSYDDGDMIINNKYKNDDGLSNNIINDINKYYEFSCSKHFLVDVKYKSISISISIDVIKNG